MKILGISAKKSGGKNTAANFILGVNLIHYGVVRGSFQILPNGQLYISDIFGDDKECGVLNQDYYTDDTIQWWQDNVWPFMKIYSFATPLKHLCIDILGLTYEQCYGTDEQKNSLTNLKWEDMPGYGIPTIKRQYEHCDDEIKYIYTNTGFMTAREVMQYVGTDIFRKMYYDVWVNTTIRQILVEQPATAVICDARFPNEIEGIKKVGGKIIRLTRSPFEDDEHDSEKALDKENFDWANFDGIIDNAEMTIPQQNEVMYNCLRPWGYIPELEE